MSCYYEDRGKMGWIFTFKLNLTLKVKVDRSTNNRDPNQGILQRWSKFGSSLERVKSCRADKQVIDTHTRTDAGNDNTWRPKLASG